MSDTNKQTGQPAAQPVPRSGAPVGTPPPAQTGPATTKAFASGLPAWDLVPPMLPVKRVRRSIL